MRTVVAEIWDYIPPIAADAATQMAIDAELADICNRPGRRAFLRFYSMSPPAVTIGRNQQWRTVVDPDRCRQNGWDWVRRPTGGGALLHHRELNYAVAASHEMFAFLSGDARSSVFQRVAGGLMAGLVRVGFRPTLNTVRKNRAVGRPTSAHGLCGAALTRLEISIDGLKAVAAAQWNLSGASLQHGAIYLQAPGADDRFWPDCADLASARQEWWACHDRLPFPHDPRSALANALMAGLAEELNLVWHPNSHDWVRSSEIVARKEQWLTGRWHEKR